VYVVSLRRWFGPPKSLTCATRSVSSMPVARALSLLGLLSKTCATKSSHESDAHFKKAVAQWVPWPSGSLPPGSTMSFGV
jgi:hypothetical protein